METLHSLSQHSTLAPTGLPQEDTEMIETFSNSGVCHITEVIDQGLCLVLTSFLNFDECKSLMTLNKQFNRYLCGGNLDLIWKGQFEYEFHLTEYPDHKRGPQETYYQYFKRSFSLYLRARSLFRNIIKLTRDLQSQHQEGEYLRPITSRKLAPLL